MPPLLDSALVWLRRDLRVDDHAALHHALAAARKVWCVFVFDRDILDPLPRADRRVEFIVDSLAVVDDRLAELGRLHGTTGVRLIVRHGKATDEVAALARQLRVQAVYASHDDDPAALARDAQVRGQLAHEGIAFQTGKDHVVFERREVMTGAGTPYGVFTPYKNAWLKRLTDADLAPLAITDMAMRLAPLPEGVESGPRTLSAIGFEPTNLASLKMLPGELGGQSLLEDFLNRIDAYADARNFPAAKGPSYLSTHLRFGTVSIRRLAREARARALAGSRGAETWLSELIWRDFYHQVLHHHPHVVERSYRPEYDRIVWEHGVAADDLFAAWCEGRTGYPLVDAAMAQINRTGYMHNRLRMVTACFLTKDLGIDWRWGEQYFAQHLNDFDLSANNGGWQWASSSGCDAQPYFRIFNPVSQSRKFDPEGKFITRYLPQLAKLPAPVLHEPWAASPMELSESGLTLGQDYPLPVVRHDEARARTLQRYAVVKKSAA